MGPAAVPLRQYVVHITWAGNAALRPAEYVGLGIPASELRDWLDGATLLLRIRPRTVAGAQTLERFRNLCARQARTGDHVQPLVLQISQGTLKALILRLRQGPLAEDRQLGEELAAALRAVSEPLPFSTRIGGRTFAWGQRTWVMGIINLTPDSFSGDGLLRAGQDPASVAERAAERALQFEQSGADILDLGAESTRPGAAGVSAQVEMERLLPALRAIRARTALPISVDTSKAEVAREALAAGADLINDVTGLQGDPAMSETVRRAGCPAVLMHNRSRGRVLRDARLGGHYVTAPYDDLILDVLEQTAALLDAALAAGIRREQLILDPGLGFGKTVRQNLALSSWTQALRALGQPILFGSSHKSFLGQVLRLPPDQRMQASLASVAAAVASGAADIIRVHDVAAAVETVRLVDALRSASLGSPRMGGR